MFPVGTGRHNYPKWRTRSQPQSGPPAVVVTPGTRHRSCWKQRIGHAERGFMSRLIAVSLGVSLAAIAAGVAAVSKR
jgi:hypothetical protein